MPKTEVLYITTGTTPSPRGDFMYIRGSALLCAFFLQIGCSAWSQKEGTVLIRQPKNHAYDTPVPYKNEAIKYWKYTALAANSYNLDWPSYAAELKDLQADSRHLPLQEAFAAACKPKSKELIPTPGWTAWTDFPTKDLADRSEKAKLFFSVWEFHSGDRNSAATELAIVFRGTQADQRQDWFSNARWFIPTWLRGEDQYVVTRDSVSKEFASEIRRRITDGSLSQNVKVTAVGHSLGGGLAQQLAYAMPAADTTNGNLKTVISFNSSPVTGWFSTPNPPRDDNTKGLVVDRIFEHGEALSYIRMLINQVIPPHMKDFDVRDIRFNLEPTAGGVKNHGSQFFACRLAEAAEATGGRKNTESFTDQDE